MKIAVYTGTFNPLHIGHLAIMEYLTGRMDFDYVYLVVSPQSPFKGAELIDSGMRRYHDACEAISRHPELKVKADPIELDMPAPQYTVRTLDALSAREPQNSFTLVMGADNLYSIRKWKDFRKILSVYGVAVYPRKGYDISAISAGLAEEGLAEGLTYRICTIDAPIVDISSTEIRQGMSEGRDMSAFLM